MKRCTKCRGKGIIPIDVDAATHLQMLIERRNRNLNGNPSITCPSCHGKGFLNTTFRSGSYFNLNKLSSRRTRQKDGSDIR